ncbi:hypothetical protein [Paratissierella segnis]|jgi:cell division protein YceG involved in septum cleavage|uniref:Endolytic transglycosylase MltG n=1 Tax=Paratissierella segnis TaxID=2763679 RepID=A0A926EYQ6_9FIRM|nr:hypothetical protein [Paratissierella segnis]MBC8588729.1 hypothetical protein [Paratissierella segnis]
MKNFLEKAKDILYDSIDYVIMFVIILVVVFVIGWRLDVLFANDAYEPNTDNEDTVIVDNSTRPEPNDNIHKPDDDNPDSEDNPEKVDNLDNDDKGTSDDNIEKGEEPAPPVPPENVSNEVTNIKIPDGSLPDKIGNILVENGIINSSKDFVSKAVELKLETKLRSGSFDIPKGSNLEQVVKIIANR